MSTRFVHNQEELKQKMIASAKSIITRQGFSDLNVREIAKRTECALGMVYKVFKGMDDIIIHINAQTLEELHAQLMKLKKGEDPESVIHKIAFTYYNFHKTHPGLWKALFEHNFNKDFKTPSFYEEKVDAIFSFIEEAFLPFSNKDRDKAYINARVLWAGVHGICTLSLGGSLNRVRIKSEKELIETLVSNCLSKGKGK